MATITYKTVVIDNVSDFFSGPPMFGDVAIDSDKDKVYIVDSTNMIIFQLDLVSNKTKTIVNTGFGNPRGLALDLTRR